MIPSLICSNILANTTCQHNNVLSAGDPEASKIECFNLTLPEY